jgi:5-methyltetrahydrofolate--homocysteine methyltransferase
MEKTMNANLESIFEGILNGDMGAVPEQVRAALAAGLTPESILKEGMIAAMAEVGSLFEEGEFFVPEMLISARAMKAGLTVLKPYLADSGVAPIGKVVIGTVQGDMHDIGKNLVGMMMEGAGFAVIDLGVDVSPQQFTDAIIEIKPQIVALSALLTTTMPQMKRTIDAVEAAGLAEGVKFLVGGAPVTPEFARQIGADGFAPDASQAASLAKSFVKTPA